MSKSAPIPNAIAGQEVLVRAAAAVQPMPLASAGGAAQTPLVSQTNGAAQSLTDVHAFRHAPLLSHLYGEQS